MGDWWSDFSNNLATDLAPLIALFGEAPTKQYLSECVSVTDIIIFSTAPLGIITTIVSAIRVCGTPSLRAFIGRAQEGAGNAEAELCSSTSREVCELYNNGGIARVFGRPKLLEVVHDPDATNDDFYRTGAEDPSCAIHLFKDYLDKKNQEWVEINKHTGDEEKVSPRPDANQDEQNFAPSPNLSLNVGIKQGTAHRFIAAAILGVVLQIGVLVWAIVGRYRLKYLRNDLQDLYAIPLVVLGTLLLCAGTALCASLIEGRTKERVFERKCKTSTSQEKLVPQKGNSQIYWIQPGTQFVGDQAFDSFAYTHPKNHFTRYTTSWKLKKSKRGEIWVWVGILSVGLGFLLQFLGLRACHSSVAVVQLAVTIVMSVVRSMLRANRLREDEVFLAHKPDLYQAHELDWLALNIGSSIRRTESGHTSGPKWEISPLQFNKATTISVKRRKLLKDLGIPHTQVFPDAATEFQHLFVIQTNECVISGFRLDRGDHEGQQTGHYDKSPEIWWNFQSTLETWRADVQLAAEEWRAEAQSKLAKHNVTGRPHDFVKALLYRARFARLTSSWNERLVSGRKTTQILAQAIEATMRAVSSPGFLFEKGWDETFTLFWSVKCSIDGKSTTGNIYLSLSREIDRYGRSVGGWRVDYSELEAVLSLWLWSLKAKGTGSQTTFRRILSANSQVATNLGLAMEFELWKEDGGSSIEVSEAQKSPQGLPLFGWHNVPTNNSLGSAVLELPVSTTSLSIMCAQEIYSLFFTSIVRIIKDIGGKTEVKKNRNFNLVNTNIVKIQDAFTDSGLGSVSDAFTCIFPALIMQGKLPPTPEALLSTGKIADTYIEEERWEEAQQLLLWALTGTRQLITASELDENQIPDPDLSNNLRLLTLSLCECYRQALLADHVHFSLKGILEMLDAPNFKNLEGIPLCLIVTPEKTTHPRNKSSDWFEHKNVEKSQHTLADTIRCYGIAAIRIARSKSTFMKDTLESLESVITVPPILEDEMKNTDVDRDPQYPQMGIKRTVITPLCRAAMHGRLDSMLYILSREAVLNDEKHQAAALFKSAQQGWFMVVKAMLGYGAWIERKSQDSRTVLSYAAEIGDINTFTFLMEKGASPYNMDLSDQSPLFYAMRSGHLNIVKKLIADGRVGTNSGTGKQKPIFWAAANGHTKMFELLLAQPGIIHNETDGMFRHPLHYAAEHGHAEIVELLLSKEGIMVDDIDADGTSPLCLAITKGHSKIVEMLLATGKADPNQGAFGHSSPLQSALYEGYFEVAKLLLGSTALSQEEFDDCKSWLATPRHLSGNAYDEAVNLLEHFENLGIAYTGIKKPAFYLPM